MYGERLYYKSEFGFSRRCNCHAGAVHVHFGNIALLLTHQQISDFSRYIGDTVICESEVEDRDERSIHLPTRDHSISFALSYNELKLVVDILEHTLLMIEVDQALELN